MLSPITHYLYSLTRLIALSPFRLIAFSPDRHVTQRFAELDP